MFRLFYTQNGALIQM